MSIALRCSSPGAFEVEAQDAGLVPVGTITVGPTELHVGSEIVLLEAAG